MFMRVCAGDMGSIVVIFKILKGMEGMERMERMERMGGEVEVERGSGEGKRSRRVEGGGTTDEEEVGV